MITLAIAATLAAAAASVPDPRAAEVTLAVAAVKAMLIGDQPVEYCVAVNDSDPPQGVLRRRRRGGKKVVPRSRCAEVGDEPTLVEVSATEWNGVPSTTIKVIRRVLHADKSLGCMRTCTLEFHWRSGRWVQGRTAYCSVT